MGRRLRAAMGFYGPDPKSRESRWANRRRSDSTDAESHDSLSDWAYSAQDGPPAGSRQARDPVRFGLTLGFHGTFSPEKFSTISGHHAAVKPQGLAFLWISRPLDVDFFATVKQPMVGFRRRKRLCPMNSHGIPCSSKEGRRRGQKKQPHTEHQNNKRAGFIQASRSLSTQ